MLKSFSMHEPSEEARQTINSILTEGSVIKLLPTHCINASGELEGFQFTVPASERGGVLPINRYMFHGTSLFEVLVTGKGVFNSDVMRLLHNTEEAREMMRGFMKKISEEAAGREATFRCVPDNVDSMSVRADGSAVEARVTRANGKRNVDFGEWRPELPNSIGLYQAFCRGYQKDTRSHKLFIGINGGLNRCSDEFYNLCLDVGDEFTCMDIAASEEAWWLRKASQRARACLALKVADHFGLSIPKQKDLFSYEQGEIGVPVLDTMEFDLKEGENSTVEFYSACVDTTSIQNGIACNMHPSEGIWIFRGGAKSSAKTTSFGSLFGSKCVCGVFPSRSPFYKRNSMTSHVQGMDSEVVVRHSSDPRSKMDGYVFQCFDESFFENLSQNLQWDRNFGVTELVPIVVGLA